MAPKVVLRTAEDDVGSSIPAHPSKLAEKALATKKLPNQAPDCPYFEPPQYSAPI
jgi:hypothetical protein